jgi:uncharacterized membrane-anchored protein
MRAWRTLLIVAAVAGLAPGQESAPEGEISPELRRQLEVLGRIEWSDGPSVGKLGDVARVTVPDAYRFTGAKGTRELLELWGNLSDESDCGLLEPKAEEQSWSVVFEWSPVGKVEDDETLDADALFSQMKVNEPAANEERRRRGFEPLELVRFTTPPHYDAATNNLEWGVLVRSQSGDSINYQVKLLGRAGFMSATLLCEPDAVEAILPEFRRLLQGYSYVEGQTYAEWTQGDPIAEYGITGLVLGGAAAAAWKMGLLGKLAKFGKVIVVAVLAGIGAIWKFFTGRRRDRAAS